MEINIEQEESVSKGRFFVESDNETLAEMSYSIAGSHTIIIDHTEVSETLRGKKVGHKLLTAAVAYARDNNKRIMPLCPFAKSQFDKNQQIRDVLLA